MSEHVPRRSGILETVQAIPTSTTPTARVSARGDASANSTKDNVKTPDPVNNTPAKGTNSSSDVNDNVVTNNVTVVQNVTNKLQNLATYSLDPPNSFSRPTRIPAIDTISAAWPTPMGSIDNEMDDVGNPPSMQPITNEMSSMSSNEKIPDIDEISDVARIPLDFQEEPAWERSHASVANVTDGHATHGHAMSSFGHAASRHFVPTLSGNRKKLRLVKSRKIISTYARRRENVVAHPRVRIVSRSWKTNLKVRKFKRKEKLLTRTHSNLKHKNSQHTAKRNRKGKKRVSIPPPKPIDPIQPLLETFEKEKEVGDIKEHAMDIEAVKPNEEIDKHLISLKSQPKIDPITQHISKEKPADVEPIQSHQLVENAK